MPRSKQRIPTNSRQQNRQAILSQDTTFTEGVAPTDIEEKAGGTVGHGPRGSGQAIEPVDRAMFATTSKVPWDKFGVYVTLGLAAIGFIWFLASQDSAVKNLTDDVKDLKKKSDDATRFTIETGIRLGNVEQHLSAVDKRENTPIRPGGPTSQTPSTRP